MCVCARSLEKGVATDSSSLAWRIPRTEELGGLQSIGSHSVRHNWSDLARSHEACRSSAHSFTVLSAK